MRLSRQTPLAVLIIAVLLVIAVLLAGCGAGSAGCLPSTAKASVAATGFAAGAALGASPGDTASQRRPASRCRCQRRRARGSCRRPAPFPAPARLPSAMPWPICGWRCGTIETHGSACRLLSCGRVQAGQGGSRIRRGLAGDPLRYDFTVDVRAAQRLLARGARLVRVIVPACDVAWVSPGACSNSVGLLARSRRPRRLPRARARQRLVRHRLADLLPRRVVRGPLRCRAAERGDRGQFISRRRPWHPWTAGAWAADPVTRDPLRRWTHKLRMIVRAAACASTGRSDRGSEVPALDCLLDLLPRRRAAHRGRSRPGAGRIPRPPSAVPTWISWSGSSR